MRLQRSARLAALFSSVLALSACATNPNIGDPSPSNSDVSVVTDAPGGLAGVVSQVDRAREVAADLEQRNTSLEAQLP